MRLYTFSVSKPNLPPVCDDDANGNINTVVKRCPACGTTYTDDTLKYCLADGSPLTDGGDETVTVVRQLSDQAKTIAIAEEPTVAASTRPHPTPASPASNSTSVLIKVLIALAVAVLLGVLVVIAAALIIYMSAVPAPATPANTARPNTVASPAPTSSRSESDELRDQIADLQKQLEQQRRSGSNTLQPYSTPAMRPSGVSARVESPRDGFLALRSLPSSEIGDRLTTIPHGARVALGACGPVTSANRRGRWCQASYGGYSGWVFDGYLIYETK